MAADPQLRAHQGPQPIHSGWWGNLEDIDPTTGDRVTVGDLYRFAPDSLRLDYVFWETQEPYYSEEILPRNLRALSTGDE